MSMTSDTDVILHPEGLLSQEAHTQVEGVRFPGCAGPGDREGPGSGVAEGIPWGAGELTVSGCTEATGEATSSPMPQGTSSFWRPFFLARHRRYTRIRQIWGQGLRASPSSGGVAERTVTGVQGTQSPHYLEPLAKRSPELESVLTTKCPGYWIHGSCENGHRYAKELHCGREWCDVCGEEWSAAHQRRFARWLSKAQQVRTMGYFVFTLPVELRAKFRTQKALSRLGHQVQELLRSYGYSRGLRRWHFFGDQSTRWHPHLNVLVDGGYLSPAKLDLIKAAYAGILGVDLADVNYRYRRSPGEKVHSLKYVTRATFLEWEWDPEMAQELHGFRNQLWWGSGKWDKEPAWSLDDLHGAAGQELSELDARAVESLESGTCPRCGKPIDWGKVLPISVLEQEVDKRSLGAGYWELPAVRPPPGRLKFPHLDKIEYWLKVCRAAGVQAERIWPDG